MNDPLQVEAGLLMSAFLYPFWIHGVICFENLYPKRIRIFWFEIPERVIFNKILNFSSGFASYNIKVKILNKTNENLRICF